MTIPTKLENFFIPGEFLAAIDLPEINATFAAMVECGIAGTPFEQFYITVPFKAVVRITNCLKPDQPHISDNDLFEFRYSGIEQPEKAPDNTEYTQRANVQVLSWRGKSSLDWCDAIPKALADNPAEAERLIDSIGQYGGSLLRVLVVSLATKQITKSRAPNKLAKLGIGKSGRKSRHSYTTTISAPNSGTLPTEHESGRGPMRPHLRRGHVRAQHYGPNNSMVKKIFVEATFVNTDKEFVSIRDHYNVSLKGLN